MNYKNAAFTILFVHFFAIGLLALLSPSLPTDMLENLFWGQNLAWSFEKHPPLTGAEAFFFYKLFGVAGYRLLAPLNAVILLYCVFLLSAKILRSEKRALLALILCYGVFFHAFYYKFNANTANYGLFGIATLVFYLALRGREFWLFVPLGLLLGLIMLTKYSGVMLLGSFFLCIVLTNEGKQALKSPFLYAGIVAFLGILAPHIVYIFKAEYSPVHYALTQSGHGSRLRNTVRFFSGQFAFLLPLLIAFLALRPAKKRVKRSFDSIFLLSVGLLPPCFTLVYQVFTGASVGSYWLSMYYFLLPTTFLFFFKTKPNTAGASIVTGVFCGVTYCALLLASLLQPAEDTQGMGEFKRDFLARFKFQAEPREYICADPSNPRNCYQLAVFEPKNPKLYVMAKEKPEETMARLGSSRFLIIGQGSVFEGVLPEYYFLGETRVFEKKFRFRFAKNVAEYCKEKPFCARMTGELFAPNKLTLTIAIKNDRAS